jgi:hypothetical protein
MANYEKIIIQSYSVGYFEWSFSSEDGKFSMQLKYKDQLVYSDTNDGIEDHVIEIVKNKPLDEKREFFSIIFKELNSFQLTMQNQYPELLLDIIFPLCRIFGSTIQQDFDKTSLHEYLTTFPPKQEEPSQESNLESVDLSMIDNPKEKIILEYFAKKNMIEKGGTEKKFKPCKGKLKGIVRHLRNKQKYTDDKITVFTTSYIDGDETTRSTIDAYIRQLRPYQNK